MVSSLDMKSIELRAYLLLLATRKPLIHIHEREKEAINSEAVAAWQKNNS